MVLHALSVSGKTGRRMSEIKLPFFLSEQSLIAPDVLEITCRELHRISSDQHFCNLKLIDVRSHDECSSVLGSIFSSHQIDLEEIETELTQFAKSTPIVFICKTGVRSTRAAMAALEMGFTKIWNLRGGLLEWAKHGLTTDQNQQGNS